MRTTFTLRALPYLAAATLLLVSCSKGGSSPTAPLGASLPTGDPSAPLSIAPSRDSVVMGQVHVTLNPDTGAVTTDPVRINQAIGDAYMVGLNQLDALCECFHVTGLSKVDTPTGAEVTLEVAFDHPFPLTSRPDLFGWDLKAILATDEGVFTFPNAALTVPAGVLVNAAGYTEEWTPQIRQSLPALASDAFPYVILGEDRAIPQPFDFTNPLGWNVFPSGGTNTGELVLNIPAGETYDFDLFFTVGYQVSATRQTRQTPDYQPPRGNTRAPFRVDAEVTANTLTAAAGTFATVDLDIWDWQHASGLSSDVTAINVYAPELTATVATPAVGPESGRDVTPITSGFAINNTLGTFPGGTTYALVEVLDALHQSNPGGTGGAPGVGVVNDNFAPEGTLDNIRTFQVITLPVDANLPGSDPTAIVLSTPPHAAGVLTISQNVTVQWDASTSTDPDPGPPENTIVGYEWDFEWDGIVGNFTDDTAGLGTANESHQYTTLGTTTLGCRVTDGVGRKSPIAAITVDVILLSLQLVLEPEVDLNIIQSNTNREFGPALAERLSGDMSVTFHTEQDMGGGGYFSLGIMSTRNSGTGVWDGANPAGGLGSSGPLEYGWVTKVCPNWSLGHTIFTHTFTDRTTHEPAHEIVFGAPNPMPPYIYAINARHTYSTDVACSRVDNSLYFFEDRFSQLRCSKGGPTYPDAPVFWWWDDPSVIYTTIDARPSQVSRSRSTFTGASGSLHIAYRSQDRSQLRYARDLTGTNSSLLWTIADLATGVPGEFGDPSFDLDEAGGAVIAVSRQVGANYELQVFSSNDGGATWGAPITAGTSFTTRPEEVAVSARFILGQRIIVIGYSTGLAASGPSEIRVRWSPDTTTWTDQLLSTGANGLQPDVLLKRTGNEFYGTWVVPGALPTKTDVIVRRGTFQII